MSGTTKSVKAAANTIKKLGTTPNSFNNKSSAFNLRPDLPQGLFYHPAPATTTPLLTPKIFLPSNDKRKNSSLYLQNLSYLENNSTNMPKIYQSSNPKNYLHDNKIIEKIQNMRDNGIPRREIKATFNVSDHFINITTKANSKTIELAKKRLSKTASNWSIKRKNAKIARQLRNIEWERY